MGPCIAAAQCQSRCSATGTAPPPPPPPRSVAQTTNSKNKRAPTGGPSDTTETAASCRCHERPLAGDAALLPRLIGGYIRRPPPFRPPRPLRLRAGANTSGARQRAIPRPLRLRAGANTSGARQRAITTFFRPHSHTDVGVEGGRVGTRPRYLIVCPWRPLSASRHCSF